MKITPLVCVSLLLFGGLRSVSAAEPIVAQKFYRTFAAQHPVLARIKPGDVVTTRTLDAAARDEKGELRAEPGNPLTGPFYIEGAEPGDALIIHFRKVRIIRPWGFTSYRLGTYSLLPETIASLHPMYAMQYRPNLVFPGRSNIVRWDVDLEKQTVRLNDPKSETGLVLEFPARPMIGCVGVAPAGDFAPTSGPAGSYGGNLDYNEIGEGATVMLPVYHPGALFFIGDGHALQGDGEPTGNGIEIPMEVEFTTSLRKQGNLSGPRVETADFIISVGAQPEFVSSLDRSIKMATSDMVEWLMKDYKLESWAAAMLIGYAGKYDVITVAGSMGLRIPKKHLPKR
jgi:acetamidase/formamidase